jgi:hypothetical protein
VAGGKIGSSDVDLGMVYRVYSAIMVDRPHFPALMTLHGYERYPNADAPVGLEETATPLREDGLLAR